jgi:hypothetical protein
LLAFLESVLLSVIVYSILAYVWLRRRARRPSANP